MKNVRIRLGELLVKHNLITITQLQQGLKAQKVYGGKLGTNLVELGFISETRLTEFLSKQFNIPAANAKDFEDIPQNVLDMMAGEFAAQHRAIPIRFDNNKVTIAFGDPLDFEAREAAAFSVGRPIVPLVAPEILINYALEKFYNISTDRRFVNISEAASEEGNLEELMIRVPTEEVDSEEVEISKVTLLQDVGKYTLAELSEDFFNATSREHVFKALFRFLEPHCRAIAVFILRHREIWGWLQQGFTIDAEKFRQKYVTVDDPSAIARTFRLRDLDLEPVLAVTDRRIVRDLGANPEGAFQLFPVLVGGKTVAVILTYSSDPAEQKAMAKKTDDIQEALTKGSIALQMVRLRRKLMDPS